MHHAHKVMVGVLRCLLVDCCPQRRWLCECFGMWLIRAARWVHHMLQHTSIFHMACRFSLPVALRACSHHSPRCCITTFECEFTACPQIFSSSMAWPSQQCSAAPGIHSCHCCLCLHGALCLNFRARARTTGWLHVVFASAFEVCVIQVLPWL